MSTSVMTERIAESEVGCVFVIHTDKRPSVQELGMKSFPNGRQPLP
jgi:hypothetical protein